jgi:hypothetical protein
MIGERGETKGNGNDCSSGFDTSMQWPRSWAKFVDRIAVAWQIIPAFLLAPRLSGLFPDSCDSRYKNLL